MLLESILLALWAGLAGVDLYNGLTHVHRPVFSGLVVGLILGDIKTGLIAGALIEFSFMGLVAIAGSQPPNVVIGSIVGISFAILTHSDPKIAVGISIPFAIMMQFLIVLLFTTFSFLIHKADKLAEKTNVRGLANLNYYGLIALFTLYFIVAFFPIYFGAEPIKNLLEKFPSWLMSGMTLAGGLLPAIGFAMLLKIMLKKEYIAYFIAGFVMVTYLKLPILAITLFALALALIDYYTKQKILKEVKEEGLTGNNKDDNGI